MYYYPVIHSYGLRASINQNNLQILGDDTNKTYPIDDIGLTVCLTEGIQLTSNVISQLTKQNVPVIFTDNSYKPVSITRPLHQTDTAITCKKQANLSSDQKNEFWQTILDDKIANQETILSRMVSEPINLPNDEAQAARRYWKQFFSLLGQPGITRRTDSNQTINGALNFGYAVLNSMVHRMVVAHGLLPSLGLHHTPRRGAYPLVYDLMEPFRPMMDTVVFDYFQKNQNNKCVPREFKQKSVSFLLDDQNKTNTTNRRLIFDFIRSFKQSLNNETCNLLDVRL